MLGYQTKSKEQRAESRKPCALCSMLLFAIVFTTAFCLPSSGQEGGKVAVLYFTDHSRFDSGGCLSLGPLKYIFGTGQKREKWDVKSGFRDLLNERLSEAGYNIVEPRYVDRAIQEAGEKNPAALASELGADAMIVGDIRKFEQHRARARHSQAPTIASGEAMTIRAIGGIGGYYYSASVETDTTIYDSSGDELESAEINSKKDLQDFFMGLGPMTKSFRRGDGMDKDKSSEQEPPIVDYSKLNAMKFGSDEFKNRTLFGVTTMDVMGKIVAKVGEHIKPAISFPVQGKIIYVGTGERLKDNEIYINLGAGDGIRPGLRLGVYIEGLQLTDPDTGEELGTVDEKKVGVIKVSKVEADHLSIAEVIEKTGQIERGNTVKRE